MYHTYEDGLDLCVPQKENILMLLKFGFPPSIYSSVIPNLGNIAKTNTKNRYALIIAHTG